MPGEWGGHGLTAPHRTLPRNMRAAPIQSQVFDVESGHCGNHDNLVQGLTWTRTGRQIAVRRHVAIQHRGVERYGTPIHVGVLSFKSAS